MCKIINWIKKIFKCNKIESNNKSKVIKKTKDKEEILSVEQIMESSMERHKMLMYIFAPHTHPHQSKLTKARFGIKGEL